jgi:hypothetical protein
MDVGFKQCKKCQKEYTEKENFKWVCRTHKSIYNEKDDIWWCCSKKGKNQPGCMISSHESKEDEDEDDVEKDKDQNQLSNVRCMCCKELGHAIKDCPRDPNLRSRGDSEMINGDYQRILKIKENKKFFVDTAVTTTHFLKKCIKVRKFEEITGEANAQGGLTRVQILQKYKDYEANKFQRGAMMFEDFNYHQFNKYILLAENQEFYEEEEGDDTISGSQHQAQLKSLKGPKAVNAQIGVDDDDEKVKLNEQALQESIKESYQHSQFDTNTELEKQQAIENEHMARVAKEIAENEARLQAEEDDEEEQGEGKDGDGEEEGAQGKQNNEDEDEETGDED